MATGLQTSRLVRVAPQPDITAGQSTWPRQTLHPLIPLVAGQASHNGDPSIWPGSRGSHVKDFTFNLQHITGPRWIWPLQFTVSPDNTAGKRQAAVDEKAHGDRSRVPAASRQARKQTVHGSLSIKVKRLRIQLAGKCFDLGWVLPVKRCPMRRSSR
jgi:hypothetical protein